MAVDKARVQVRNRLCTLKDLNITFHTGNVEDLLNTKAEVVPLRAPSHESHLWWCSLGIFLSTPFAGKWFNLPFCKDCRSYFQPS